MTRIRFENSPSTNTPINAENLNKLNNVIVSSEEPTTGEEVWIERSGNLFDGEIELGNIDINTGINADNSVRTRSKNYIKVEPNTTYIFKRTTKGGNKWVLGYNSSKTLVSDVEYKDGSDVYKGALAKMGTNEETMVFKTTSTTEYIRWYDNNCTNTNEVVTIEKYPKKIYIKTDNGYEEYFNAKDFRRCEVVYDGNLLVGESVILNGVKRYLDVYFNQSSTTGELTGKYTLDTTNGVLSYGSSVLLAPDESSSLDYYVDESTYDRNNKKFTHTRSGYFRLSSGSFTSRNTVAYRVYRIETYD